MTAKAIFALSILSLLVLSACARAAPTPDTNATMEAMVREAAATLTAAAPLQTATLVPTPTKAPSRTPTAGPNLATEARELEDKVEAIVKPLLTADEQMMDKLTVFAKSESTADFKVFLGVANPQREAWFAASEEIGRIDVSAPELKEARDEFALSARNRALTIAATIMWAISLEDEDLGKVEEMAARTVESLASASRKIKALTGED